MKHTYGAASLFICNAVIGVFVQNTGEYFTIASIFLLAAFLISSFAYSNSLYSKKINPLSFSVFLYYSYGFVLPGLYVVRTDQFYWFSNALSAERIERSAILVFCATIALVLGRFIRFGPQVMNSNLQGSKNSVDEVLKNRDRQILLLVIFAVAIFIFYNFMTYGTRLFWGTRQSIGIYASSAGLDAATTGLSKLASQALALASFALTSFIKFRLHDKSKLVSASFLLSIVLLLAANNPLFTPRYWMVATVTVILNTIFYSTFRNFKSMVYFSTPALMFFVFPFLGTINRRGESLTFEFSTVSPFSFMTHGDLDGFQSITNAIKLVEVDGLGFGSRFLSAIFFFIPRSIWGEKQIATGSDAAEAAGYSFTRISMPLPGELYSDGGFFLAMLGMFLVGISIRTLDHSFEYTAYKRDSARELLFPVLTVLLAGFSPILMRGSLLSVISGVMTSFFMVYLWTILCRIRVSR